MPKSKFVVNLNSFFAGVCTVGILFFFLGFNPPNENVVGRYQAATHDGTFLILDTSTGDYIRNYSFNTWVFEKFNVPNSQERYNTVNRKNLR